MCAAAHLFGAAPRGLYRARTGDGDDANPSEAIFPIVTQEPDGRFRLIGTGFFIAEQGIFATAAHVAEAVIDADGKALGPFGMFQFLAGNQYCVRQIHRATRHKVADIAVGVAMPMHHKKTGKPMPNLVLTLSLAPPPINSHICTYAYPMTTIEHSRPQVIRFEPHFFEGTVLEQFASGRDRVLLPGACFSTSMVIHGGASGGPVIGPDGTVFAVNSTGFENDTLSYVTCLSQILDIPIPDIELPGDKAPRVVTIRELRDRGLISAR